MNLAVSSRQRAPVARRRGLLARGVRMALGTALALTLIFAVATAQVLVWSPTDITPTKVSAIVMLAGPGVRLPVALQLADEHRAPVLVVSQGYDGYGSPCPPRPAGVQLICFDPVPPTTRGEAEHIGQLAKQYHWSSLILVTSRPQALRADLIVGRCFTGTIYSSTGPLPMRKWPYEIAYGWAALTKAVFVARTC